MLGSMKPDKMVTTPTMTVQKRVIKPSAKAVPKGRVYALDTQAEMVRHIHHKAMRENVSNVQGQVIKPDDPVLPAGADVVFVCDVLHHVQDRPVWLKK